MNLYHFTRREYLSSIFVAGLDTGDIHLNPAEGVNGVCLTEIANPVSQWWTNFVPQKKHYRLTVEIDPQDRLLMKWKYVPDLLKMERSWWKDVTRIGGGDPYKWWVFFGVIHPSQIIEVFDAEKRRNLTDTEIHRIKREPLKRGKMIMATKVLTYQEALREPTAARDTK